MRTFLLLSLSSLALLVGFGCDRKVPETANQCITGIIVDDKCGVYALQVKENNTGYANDWEGRDSTGQLVRYANVVGLLNLPANYRKPGTKIHVRVRQATAKEQEVPCYLDYPGPPSPMVYVLTASDKECIPLDGD